MMNSVKTAISTPRAAALVAILFVAQGMTANLVAYFGITKQVAGVIVTMIVSGGGWALAVMFPFVVPVQITVQTLVKVFGTAYAIGW